MQMDIDEPICVIDIDIILVNDYNKLFDYPVKRGQFLAILWFYGEIAQKIIIR